MVNFQILSNMEKTFCLHREFFPPQPPFFVTKKHQRNHRPSKAVKLLLYRSQQTCWSFFHQVLMAMLFPKQYRSFFSLSLSYMHTWFLWLNQVSRGTVHFLCHDLDLKSGSEISHIAKKLNEIPSYNAFFKNSLTVIWVTEKSQGWRAEIKRSKKIFPLPLNSLCVSTNIATDVECPILDLLK